MGVHGLWELLAPVGRRVSVETLAGKRLAIDASIWMVQFMKAMRDEKGEMVRNAHLLGFFRRICKLLFLRTKPVFVFDGATPALKRRTLAARRRHRDAARAKIRKTAEKLLISHLKARKLEELAEELKKSSQRKEDAKGKNVESTSSADHQKLDELLAASLAAEEEADGAGGASTSAALEDEMEDEEDEEMILPLTGDNIDPAVLASLPPSMQLDLLVQMRERMMAENRQKYQKIKKSPAKFSELQIQSYLKTVAFRREIDEVQRCASGKGLGGVQTSKIASETNREFIFSSSFTGDKQMLAQKVGSNGNADSNITKKYTPSDSILNAATTSRSATEAPINELGTKTSSEIETYKDERGRVRVSRLRGLGIRMTRDIQRNLDLMKEYEQESNMGEYSAAIKDGPSVETNDLTTDFSLPKNEVIEISFLEDPEEAKDSVDDIFLHLAAGVTSNKEVEVSDDTEDIWEDGIVDENGTIGLERDGKKVNNIVWTGNSSEGDDVDWEDGASKMHATTFNGQSEQAKISKGVVEEEALMQEAIRRSLEESSVRVTRVGKPDNDSQSELPMASKGVVEEEALVQEAIRRSLEESVAREFRVSICDDKIGSSILEEKENNEGEVDWEEGSCHSPINTTISPPDEQNALMQEAMRSSKDLGREQSSTEMPGSTDAVKPGKNSSSLFFDIDSSPVESKGNGEESPPEEQDVLMQEAVMRSSNDLARENFTTEMPGSPDAVKPGQNSSSLAFNSDTSPVENRGKGKESPNEDYAGKNTCNVSDVSVNCKPSQTNVKNLQGRTMHSRSHTVSPEFVEQQQADTISNIKGPIGSSDLGSISERKVHELDSSDSNQFDSSSKGPVASSDPDSSERGVHEFHKISYSNRSFSGLSDDNNVAKESTGINLVSDMPIGGDADTADEILMDDLSTISEANLQEEISLLRQEQAELGQQRKRLESHAEAVSNEMFAECQELLQMFGLPYIIAPTEAEAQCAFMEMNNLVDGVVTDDSDVFLFGARSVYKNIFDDRKYVETYFMKDIESELGLNREMLIRMAMLLGSDYTEGVSGIGIVNAIEVVHAFPEEDGLKKFREWVESPDPSILENFELGLKKKLSKDSKEGELPNTEDVKETFMDKHRNISKNWHLPASFPSQAVVDAYYSPQVDNSKETFSWGKPDLNLLRKLCWERLGWDKQKADELLLPVLKEYSKHETQLRLEAFYTFNERFAKIRSQRIQKAIKGISGGSFLGADDPVQEEPSHGRRTRKKVNSIGQKGKGRKRKSAKVPREKSNSDASGEESTDKDVPQDGSTQEMTELRRSKRQRNQAKYIEDDIEAIPDGHATNQSEATDIDEMAVDKNPSYADNDHIETVQVEASEIAVNATKAAQKEYLFSGGFCTEEGNENVNPDSDEPFEGVNTTGDSPKEYLFSGGGFCTEEGDDNVDQDTNKPNELVNEARDVPMSPSTNTKEDMIKTTSGGTDQSKSLDLNPDFPIGGRVKWGLTPMPSLKRRKS